MIYFSLFPPPKYIQLLPVTHLNPPKIYSKFVQFFFIVFLLTDRQRQKQTARCR